MYTKYNVQRNFFLKNRDNQLNIPNGSPYLLTTHGLMLMVWYMAFKP